MSGVENNKEVLKKHFETREGVYRISEYIEGQSRQQPFNRSTNVALNDNAAFAPVKITCSRIDKSRSASGFCEHICFNHGRELHIMPFSLDKVT